MRPRRSRPAPVSTLAAAVFVLSLAGGVGGAAAGTLAEPGGNAATSLSGSGTTPAFTCTVSPAEVFAGEKITITALPGDVKFSHKATFVWNSSGGRTLGEGPSAAIETSGTKPGQYTLNGQVMNKAKGPAAGVCKAAFTVRPFSQPTVVCAVDRTTAQAGDKVTITATGRSQQNRPLTYSFDASAGKLEAKGASATLSTTATPPGILEVKCSVTDDQEHVGTGMAYVAISPAAAAASRARSLCRVSFEKDRAWPLHIDDEGTKCLDDVAFTLDLSTRTRLLIVGNYAHEETARDAAERAMNAADYLTHRWHVDASRLDLRIGSDASRSVSTTLVPPGVSVAMESLQGFDAESIARRGPAYGPIAPPAPAALPPQPAPQPEPAPVEPVVEEAPLPPKPPVRRKRAPAKGGAGNAGASATGAGKTGTAVKSAGGSAARPKPAPQT